MSCEGRPAHPGPKGRIVPHGPLGPQWDTLNTRAKE